MNRSGDETERLLEQLDGLYQRDPEAFETLRQELIDHVIGGFQRERQPRARAIQFSLETRLSRYRHPVARLNKMVELFWAQFSEFRLALSDPDAVVDQTRRPRRAAKVIPLRDRARLH